MKGSSPRHPSPSMVVALLALVVSLGGTAVAASSLVNGDKLIKKQSLSGNRLRNHTLTGHQIKLSALGKVPNASHADTADNATNATNATTAADATHATTADTAQSAVTAFTASDAATLGNLPSSAFQRRCQSGAVAAQTYVKGNASFSSSYTTATPPLQDQFNCTGGIVEVKRTAAGTYDVHFAGLDNGMQLVATGAQTVTPFSVQVAGGEITYKLVFDATVNNGSGGTVYQVKLFDTAGNPVDNEFSFALLSPS